jgi:Secretion system C-terminal sorting domain
MRLKYLIVLSLYLILINSVSTQGQSIIRSSINCLGSTYTSGGLILRQTTGQASSTMVFNNGDLLLRQGFQQPIALQEDSYLNIPLKFTLSPNPAGEKSLLEFSEDISPYTIIISNINGMVMSRINNQTLQFKWLNLENYLPGIYVVTILSGRRIGSKKLIKTY